MKLQINGFEDRRNMVAILADNGYNVKIEKVKQKSKEIYGYKETIHYIIIEEGCKINNKEYEFGIRIIRSLEEAEEYFENNKDYCILKKQIKKRENDFMRWAEMNCFNFKTAEKFFKEDKSKK